MQGDKEAFENLFQKYYADLCRYSQTYLDQQGEAEDVVQDVFVNIWKQRGTIDIQVSVRNYLFSAVKHRVCNVLKHIAIQRNHSQCLKEFLEHLSHSAYSEEEERQLGQIREAFEELPEQCRKVFMMNCFENKKYTQIAADLNVSVNTVKSHMLKAYRIIRGKVRGGSIILFFIFL